MLFRSEIVDVIISFEALLEVGKIGHAREKEAERHGRIQRRNGNLLHPRWNKRLFQKQAAVNKRLCRKKRMSMRWKNKREWEAEQLSVELG